MSQSDPVPRHPLNLAMVTHEHRHGLDVSLISYRGNTPLDGVDVAFSNPSQYEIDRDDETVEVIPVPPPLTDLLRYAEREAAKGSPEAIAILARMEGPDMNAYLESGEPPYRTAQEVMNERERNGDVRIVEEGTALDRWGNSINLNGARIAESETSSAFLIQTADGQHEICADYDVSVVRYADGANEGLDDAMKADPTPPESGPKP